MTTELLYLSWTLALALAQILLAAAFMRSRGRDPWDGLDEEETRGERGPAERLARAQTNLFETLPLFAAAILATHALGRHTALTEWGASLFFWGRLAFLPFYATGIPYLKAIAWLIATSGLVLLLVALIAPH